MEWMEKGRPNIKWTEVMIKEKEILVLILNLALNRMISKEAIKPPQARQECCQQDQTFCLCYTLAAVSVVFFEFN